MEYPTPEDFYRPVAELYPFVIDMAASAANTKCPIYLTREDNALEVEWAEVVREAREIAANPDGWWWCNPPYGRNVKHWCRKAWEAACGGSPGALLIKAAVSAKYFKKFVFGIADRVDGGAEFVRMDLGPYPGDLLTFYRRAPDGRTIKIEVFIPDGRLSFSLSGESGWFNNALVIYEPI